MMRGLLFWLSLQVWAAWATPVVVDHIVLVDVSGSMRQRGYADAQGWKAELPDFLKALLKPDDQYFGEASQFSLRPFSDVTTDQKEGRVALGPASLRDFSQRWSQVAPPGGGATDMSRALDLAQLSLQASAHPGVVWLVTDNENNFTSNQSDQQFYERLRDSPDFNSVYLFPLANPQVRPSDSLVMYLLVPPRVLDSEQVADLARQVEKKTGYQGMLFRPLYSETQATTLDFSKELTFEGPGSHRVEQEGGQTVLYFEEGEKLQGSLLFRIRSRLKGWKVEGASLQDAEVDLKIPSIYQGSLQTHLKWKVTPNILEVAPEQDSLTMFRLQIAGPQGQPISLQRKTSQLLSHLFTSWLPQIEGKVTMKAVLHLDQGSLRHQVPEAMQVRLNAVPRLADIESYMVKQQDLSQQQGHQREIVFERRVVVKVKADPSSTILMGILMAVAAALAAALGSAVLFWKIRLQLEGSGLEEEVSLAGLYGSYLICNAQGLPHCRLLSRLGSLSLKAEPGYQFEQEAIEIPLRWEGDEFRLEVGPEGKPPEVFWLRRRRHSSQASFSGEGPL